MKTILTFLIFLAAAAHAANHYVRQGAAGTATGADWTNATTDLPSSLTRGDTYYIADGTAYGAHVFNDTESGTAVITIKKATIADHGTATGWVDTYGDGTAIWTGRWDFMKGYYTLDGVTRNESDWTSQVYGFRVTCANISYPGGLGGSATSNIILRYVDAGAPVGTVYNLSDSVWNASSEGFNINNGTGLSTGMVLSHCFLHNTTLIMLNNVDGATIEYMQLKDMWAKEAIRGLARAKNITVRYCKFQNTTRDTGVPSETGTAPIAAWSSATTGDYDGWRVYGNVFWDTLGTEHSGGAIHIGGNIDGYPGVNANDCLVYNNTIYGFTGDLSAVVHLSPGTGNEIRNTLWYNCIGTPEASPDTSNNGEQGSDPFVDKANGDFRLIAGIAGTAVGAPYSTDLLGNAADATTDRGAFQFGTLGLVIRVGP